MARISKSHECHGCRMPSDNFDSTYPNIGGISAYKTTSYPSMYFCYFIVRCALRTVCVTFTAYGSSISQPLPYQAAVLISITAFVILVCSPLTAPSHTYLEFEDFQPRLRCVSSSSRRKTAAVMVSPRPTVVTGFSHQSDGTIQTE